MHNSDFPRVDDLLILHNECKFTNLDKPQLEPEDVLSCIKEIEQQHGAVLRSKILGKSVQDRPIRCFSVGSGKTHLLCWSQMHGDESTATAALLDIMRLLCQQQNQPWLQKILANVTLHMVPMLNPDGAKAHSRQNHQGIDINRDADALQSPEANILKLLIDDLSPDYAFNLHDQSRYYAATNDATPVAMAFMAPPGDQAESLSPHRLAAMQLIGNWTQAFKDHLNGRVAKYVDSYSNQAFGDYATSQGVATILIESGELHADPTRQIARCLNFALLLQSMHVIAEGQHKHLQGLEAEYHAIPENRENGLFDVLITNVQVQHSAHQYQVDLGLRYCEQLNANLIEQIGDLSGYGGMQKFDATGYHFECGSTFVVEQRLDLNDSNYRALLGQGYCRFSGDISLISKLSSWPIVQMAGHNNPVDFYRRKQIPSGLLINEKGVAAAMLNGELIWLN